MSGATTDQNTKSHTLTLPVAAVMTAADYGKAVTIDSNGHVAISTAGASVDGIYQGGSDADEIGAAGEVVTLGPVVKMLLGGTVNLGDKVKSDSTGRAVTANAADILAGVDFGICTKAGAVNGYGSILFYGSNRSSASGVQALTDSGAINATTEITTLAVTGTDAYSMADGLYVGQRKIVRCILATGTPHGVVTPTTVSAYAIGGTQPASVDFMVAGQEVEYEWHADGWAIVNIVCAGVEAVTAGQAGNPLFQVHTAAIADTVDFLVTAGIYAGQKSRWVASANSGTPVGTLSGLFYLTTGAATGVDVNFNAASDAVDLEWSGARWFATSLTSATIS